MKESIELLEEELCRKIELYHFHRELSKLNNPNFEQYYKDLSKLGKEINQMYYAITCLESVQRDNEVLDDREFTFSISEIKKAPDDKLGHIDILTSQSGYVRTKNGEITVSVDDIKQPQGTFKSNVNWFNKLIKKIQIATKQGE